MDTSGGLYINQNASTAWEQKKYSLNTVILMLFSRTLLFIIFQCIFFVIFLMMRDSSPWEQAANWWPFSVTFTNIVCVFLLRKLYGLENRKFKDFFVFERGTIAKSILMMSIILIICMPIAFLPNLALGSLLFGDMNVAVDLFYRPLPIIAAWIAFFSFPMTMPFGELTVYFGYVMPRLEVITKRKWVAVMLPVLFLSFQHAALPLLFDLRFVVWRLFMFLPFAFFLAIIVRWKPKLFPYILISHFLIDVMSSLSTLLISMN